MIQRRDGGFGLMELMVLLAVLAMLASLWFVGKTTDLSESRALITIKSTQLVTQYVYLYGIAQGALPTGSGDCTDAYATLADKLGAGAWRNGGAKNGWQQPITLGCTAGSRVVTLVQRIPQPELVGFILEHLPFSNAYLDEDGQFAVLETALELDFPGSLNLIREVALTPRNGYAQAELDTRGFCRQGTVVYSAHLSGVCAPQTVDGNPDFWVQRWRVKDSTLNPKRKLVFRVVADIQHSPRVVDAIGNDPSWHPVAVDTHCRPDAAPEVPSQLSILAFCDNQLQ